MSSVYTLAVLTFGHTFELAAAVGVLLLALLRLRVLWLVVIAADDAAAAAAAAVVVTAAAARCGGCLLRLTAADTAAELANARARYCCMLIQ